MKSIMPTRFELNSRNEDAAGSLMLLVVHCKKSWEEAAPSQPGLLLFFCCCAVCSVDEGLGSKQETNKRSKEQIRSQMR